VRGDGPFAAIGRPVAVRTSPDGTLVAVGGAPSPPRWHGFDVTERPEPHRGWYPVGVYRTADLSCAHFVTSCWEPASIAFHPTLPLVAIGTGTYDGGWRSDGELLLLDLRTGDVVSVLDELRWVHRVAWRPDGETLDLVLSVRTDGEAEREGARRLRVTVRRTDWRRPSPGMVRLGALCRRPVRDEIAPPSGDAEAGDAGAIVDGLCTTHGTHRAGRGAVWALRALPDGRLLAALAGLSAAGPGIRAECWSPGAVWPDWSAPVAGAGCQVALGPDGRTALTVSAPPAVPTILDLVDGVPRAEVACDAPAPVLTARADGWFVLRGPTGAVLYRPDGDPATAVDLGARHFFDVRHAPVLLCLDDVGGQPCVVSVDVPDGRVRPLFPLDWEADRDGVPSGGPGVYLADALGAAVVHAGTIHCGFALRGGSVFVVRRAFPSGVVCWLYRADHPVTALESDGRWVYAAFNSGEVVVLDAATGRVTARREVKAGGRPVVPLSLALTGDGGLAVGTLDGLIVELTAVDRGSRR
jgi:hypothetical protein